MYKKTLLTLGTIFKTSVIKKQTWPFKNMLSAFGDWRRPRNSCKSLRCFSAILIGRIVGEKGALRTLSTSGRERCADDRHPPWRAACETRDRDARESDSSTSRSSTAGTWCWRRRREQTCRHSAHPDTRHTTGHPTRTASPRPDDKRNDIISCKSITVVTQQWQTTIHLHVHAIYIAG